LRGSYIKKKKNLRDGKNVIILIQNKENPKEKKKRKKKKKGGGFMYSVVTGHCWSEMRLFGRNTGEA